jgi:2-keto-4-pentenoate hydratase/2-oxohepta-3-ene-1,7-dioic acid hydratase in catechol pathway
VTLYCRFEHRGTIAFGIAEGDRVQPLAGDLFSDPKPAGDSIALADVRLLAPVVPRKILAAAVNYQSHVPSGSTVLKSAEAPSIPQLFLKPSSSVIGPDDTIVLPAEARRVDAEGELVAVIGRVCRNVSPEQALDYVFGYTCGNDVSARHWQRDDIQWWRAKGSDTFTPLGPYIASGLDPENVALRTRVNGAETQEGNTRDLIHSVAAMVSFASRVMTLEPGDLLFTGTPGEPPKLSDGDVVEVEIDGIGVLRNPVRREADAQGQASA